MASGREQLFAKVRTNLLLINGAGSYVNTVRAVYRDIKPYEDIVEYPAISMVEMDEAEERTPTPRELFFLARLMLLVYAKVPTTSTASTVVNSLVSDVKIALFTDWTQSNLCHRTRYIGMDPLPVSEDGITGVVMRWDFHYSHTWTTP